MNKTRRNEIRRIETSFTTIATVDEAYNIRSDIEDVLYDEQDAFDSLSEGLQCTSRGEAMEEAIDSLQGAIDSIDKIIDILENNKTEVEIYVKVKVRFRKKKLSREEAINMYIKDIKDYLIDARLV